MASFTMDAAPRFAPGSTVEVYPEEAIVNGSGPTQAALTTGVVGSTGSVTFTGLSEDTRYIAAQLQSGRWVRTNFRVSERSQRSLADIDTALDTAEDTLDSVESDIEGISLVAAPPTGVIAADAANVQALIDALSTAGRGVGTLHPGDYDISTGVTWPVGKPIKLKGAGNGGSGSIFGTRLKRTTGTTTLVTALGTGDTASTRAYVELEDLEINGGSAAGVGLRVERASHFTARNVRVANCTVEGAIFKQVWDSKTYNFIVEVCGNGETNAACLFDAVAGVGTQGGCDTFYWYGPVFQGNTGTDVKFSGSTGDTAPSNNVEMFGAKLESGAGTFPYIDFAYAKGCAFHGGRISQPSGRSGLFVKQNGTHTDFRPNRIVGMAIDKVGADAQDYLIDHGVGSLHLIGVNFPATAPALGFVRCRSTVLAGRLKISGVMRSATGVPLVVDERATPEFIGKERLRMQRQSGTAAAGLIGTTAVWDFDQAVAEDFFGNVTIPPDAIPGSQARFRFLWTSGTTTGDVVWRVTSQDSFASGEAVGGAGTAYDVTSTAPGTANQLKVAETSGGPTVNPGDALQVYASRNATVAGDTLAADARLLALEVVVDVDP